MRQLRDNNAITTRQPMKTNTTITIQQDGRQVNLSGRVRNGGARVGREKTG